MRDQQEVSLQLGTQIVDSQNHSPCLFEVSSNYSPFIWMNLEGIFCRIAAVPVKDIAAFLASGFSISSGFRFRRCSVYRLVRLGLIPRTIYYLLSGMLLFRLVRVDLDTE